MHFTSLLYLSSLIIWTNLGYYILTLLFLHSTGIPDDIIEKGRDYKLITEVTQDGDNFSWTQLYPANAKVTNTFTIGKECDMETIGGKKFKVGGKESRVCSFI